MKIDEIMHCIDIENFCKSDYERVKALKPVFSNKDRKDLTKVLVNAKRAPKEKVLRHLFVIRYGHQMKQ